MKVQEVRELVNSLKSEGKLANHKVEFVVGAIKHFAEDVKAGTDSMAFSLVSDTYHTLTPEALLDALNIARGDLDIEVIVGGSRKAVTGTYLGKATFELVVE